jgi:hypothetical protein
LIESFDVPSFPLGTDAFLARVLESISNSAPVEGSKRTARCWLALGSLATELASFGTKKKKKGFFSPFHNHVFLGG